MTANQKIDGVPRHWAEIEAAVRGAFEDGKKDYNGCMRERLRELRALLDAPVVEHQEPKGAILRFREYVGKGQGGRDLWHDWTEWSTGTVEYAKSKLDQVKDLTNVQFEVEWLYAEQPAPVAVLPDRKNVVPELLSNDEAAYRRGWNVCLDEVARLNTGAVPGVLMPGRRPIPDGIESLAQQIYQSWESQPGWVPWVEGGNSQKQNEARQIASRTFELALANQVGD